MGRAIFAAACVILFGTSCLAQSYDEALSNMRSKSESLRSYHCTFISFSRGKEKTDQVTFDYYFKKPSSIRMEARAGSIEGTVLLYRGSEVRAKPGHGVFSWFSFSFQPESKRVCDARGHTVPQSSWGWYIDEHLRMKALTRSQYEGVETIDGKKALKFELTSADPSKTESIAKEQIWIDAGQWVLLQYKQYDASGTLIQSGIYQNIQIDTELKDSLFTEFSR